MRAMKIVTETFKNNESNEERLEFGREDSAEDVRSVVWTEEI